MCPTTRWSLPASALATMLVASAEPTAAPDLAAGPTLRTGLTPQGGRFLTSSKVVVDSEELCSTENNVPRARHW